MPSPEKWVGDDSRSTSHAETKADEFERADILNARRKGLKDEEARIAKTVLDKYSVPDRAKIEMNSTYTVTASDLKDSTFGLIKVLEDNLPGVINRNELKRLSYAHMFKSSKEAGKDDTEKAKIDINAIMEGDQIMVTNGTLTITRGAASLAKDLIDITVDLYPWAEKAPAKVDPVQPEPPAPAPEPPEPAPELQPIEFGDKKERRRKTWVYGKGRGTR